MGVAQKAPHRSTPNHPHLQRLPTRGRSARGARPKGPYFAVMPATIGQPPSLIGRNACSAGIVSSTL